MTPEFRNALYKWQFTRGNGDEGVKSIPYQLQRLFIHLQVSSLPRGGGGWGGGGPGEQGARKEGAGNRGPGTGGRGDGRENRGPGGGGGGWRGAGEQGAGEEGAGEQGGGGPGKHGAGKEGAGNRTRGGGSRVRACSGLPSVWWPRHVRTILQRASTTSLMKTVACDYAHNIKKSYSPNCER